MLIEIHCLFSEPTGGHFVIFQTGSPQLIQGIELFNMGQRGIHGRYPLYWFLSQSAQNSYVKKVSIHQSKQRCLVLHGTWNLLMEQNGAYDNYGHCFFMEDGMEFGNVFRNNLAFLTVSRIRPSKFPSTPNLVTMMTSFFHSFRDKELPSCPVVQTPLRMTTFQPLSGFLTPTTPWWGT